MGTARFAVTGADTPLPSSARQLVNASNARALKATNPVVNSPQALAGAGPRGRGPADLSCLSAPDVRLPPMGMSPFEWAAMNGITISWEANSPNYGAASPDRRHIILGMQLRSLPEPVLWYALYHEIGHVLGGHSERQPRPSPVRFEWEHDADRYAALSVTVADPAKDAAQKATIAAWLNTLQADAEHEPGPKIAEALLETCATPSAHRSAPAMVSMPFTGIAIAA